jgi:hypothetical protein
MLLFALSRRSVLRSTSAWSTNRRLVERRERPGWHPVFQNIGVVSADQISVTRIVPERWTDSKPGSRVCAMRCRLSVVASIGYVDVGDGTHASHTRRSGGVSRAAIAAALALEHVAGGERLVAFALASFANRDQLAWPGTPSAAARAGLARSRYLEARNELLKRGLIETQETGAGRGRSTTVLLRFVESVCHDRLVNAELFETVLSYSRSSGSARLLLAAIAALSDERGELGGVTVGELCAAGGLAVRTYRRAGNALIASGELELVDGAGGRGHTNRWRIPDLRIIGDAGVSRPQRRAPSGPVRPLMAPVTAPGGDVELAGAQHATSATTPRHAPLESTTTTVKGAHIRAVGAEKGCQVRTVFTVKGCQVRTVSAVKGCQVRTVPSVKGGQDRMVSGETRPERGSQRGPERGPERGPSNARAWKEPGNRGTSENPPNPPEGGLCAGELFVEESYVTERGRKRKRLVRVDVDAVRREVAVPSASDREVWQAARAQLLGNVGESTFEIWLSSVELVGVDRDGSLVLAAPAATSDWVQKRFGQLISHCCEESGRGVRFASPQERVAIQHMPETGSRAVVSEQSTMKRRVS